MRHGGYASTWREDPIAPRTRENPFPIIDGQHSARQQQCVSGQGTCAVRDRRDNVVANSALPRRPRGAGWGRAEAELGIQDAGIPWRAQGVCLWRAGRDGSGVGGNRTDADGQRTALFLQDRWQVHDRVTLNLGVRADFNRGSVPDGGTVLATDPVSPRAGVAWAIDRTHDTALKLHYGRYYDALLTERVAFMDVPGVSSVIGYQPSPTGELTEVFRSAPPAARAIDPDIRHSYADQYVAEIERRLFNESLFQVLFIRRAYGDFMAMTDTGSRWTPVELQDPGPDGVLGTQDDGVEFTAFRQVNPGEQFLLYTNPPDAFRRYHALQLVYTKRWAGNWQLQASYTRSKTAATVGNGDFTNAGVNDTGDLTGTRNPSVFMNPNGAINAEGRAVYDKNELKVLGIYRVPALAG